MLKAQRRSLTVRAPRRAHVWHHGLRKSRQRLQKTKKGDRRPVL